MVCVWQHSFSIRLKSSRNSRVRPCLHCDEKQFGVGKKFENFEINFFVFVTLFAPETSEIVRIIRNVNYSNFNRS